MNRADRKEFDVPIPLKSVEDKWRELQARHRADVRLSVIDEQHTRVSVSGEPDEVDRVFEDLRRSGLGGRGAAGNAGSLGDAPGAAGGTFAGGTGGTPGPGGGKPGTTP
jgi:hypothetical protein